MGAAVSVVSINHVTAYVQSGQQYITVYPLDNSFFPLSISGSFDPNVVYNFTLNVSDGGVINLNGKWTPIPGGYVTMQLEPGSSVDLNKTYGVSNGALYFYIAGQ